MNPPLPPSDDELVSAYLDGEVTPDERARVEGDPALLAQVARFRAVVAALREPVAPDPARREQAIAAALGVLDGSVVSFPSGGRPLPPPVPQPARRRPGRWLAVAAAAAVVVAVAVIGVALSDDDGDNVATPTTQDEVTGTTSTSGNPVFPTASNVPTSPPAFGQVVALGTFADVDALVAAVGERPEAGAPAPGRTITHACAPIGAQVAYTATVAGDEVIAFLVPDRDSRLLTEGSVYAVDACTELDTFSLA